MKDKYAKYKRQTVLKSFGLENQQKLAKSQVLIVGIGGLGIPVAQYLNAMGVGTLGLLDNDTIALHNLQRQVLYSEEEVGQSKVAVAAKKLRAQNRDTQIHEIHSMLSRDNALEIIAAYDLVVDATDNFATRYLINDACVILGKPFVYGALHDFEGQVSVFNYQNGPTYRCLFPNPPKAGEVPNCDVNGILGVLPGIIGNLQALEAVKVLTGIGEVLSGKLLLFNGLTHENRLVQFKQNPKNKTLKQLEASYETPECAVVATITAEAYMKLPGTKQLLDVRTHEEFESDHLEEAIHLPLNELHEVQGHLTLSQPTYIICQSGKRSELAAKKLSDAYPEAQFYSVEGGMNEIATVWP